MSPGRITSPNILKSVPPMRCRSTSGENQQGSPSAFTRCMMPHSTSVVVVTPGVMKSAENTSSTMSIISL